MNILITGGCGFIGSNLASFYLAKGDNVYVVDDLSTGSLANIAMFESNPRFRFCKANITHWDGLSAAVEWADVVYHLAAVIGIFRVLAEPINVIETNMEGSLRIFRTVAEYGLQKRLIFTSSSCVYGDAINSFENGELVIRQEYNPLLAYGVSKLANEEMALAYYKEKNLAVTIVRLFNVIGPRQTGQYGMVVPRFVKQACDNKMLTVFGDGTQTRSFCDVRDVIAALYLLANNNDTVGQIFNVGADTEISINDLAALVIKLTNSSSSLTHISYKEAYGDEFNDTMQRKPNLQKLNQVTGFKHQWNLTNTISELIEIEKNRQ